MAVCEWVTKLESSSIRAALADVLDECGFIVDDVATTEKQVSAICNPKVVAGYWSGVRLIALWSNEDRQHAKIEVRSDEPTLRLNTHCEQRATALMRTLPPI